MNALLLAATLSLSATVELNLPGYANRYEGCNIGFNSISTEDSGYLYASCKESYVLKGGIQTFDTGLYYDEIIIDGQEFHGCELSRFVQSNDETLVQVDCDS